MAKRPSLFVTKNESALSPAIAPDAEEAFSEKIENKDKSPVKGKGRPPSREGKRVLSVYLTPEAWKQLRMLSLNLETSTQSLGVEALNLLFEKHRLNRIA